MNIIRYYTASMPQSNNFIKGDVCYAIDTQRCYMWDGSAWVALPSVDERDNIPQRPTNCVNYGAVLHSSRCEYCGTEYLN